IGDAAGILAGRVSVDPIKGSRLAYVRVTDHDPKRAKRITDAIADAYVEQNLQTAINSSSDAVVWLDGQIDHIKSDLEHNENALYEFKRKNDLPSLSINDASNMLRLEMQAYDTALTQTRTRKEELLARHAELATVTPDKPDAIASSELLSNESLQQLRGTYRNAVDQRDALLAEGKGENHPLVKEATARLADAKTSLLTEVQNIQASVVRDLAVIERQENGEAALLNEARRKAVDLNMKEIEYHRLDRTRDENEKLYALLLGRMKEADLSRMMRSNNLRVVEAAGLPSAPISPRIPLNVAMGLLAGLLAGVGLAWMREKLDSSIKTPDDLEQKLALVCLGLLPELEPAEKARGARRRRRASERPLAKGDTPELVVHERPMSGISEAARSIRTNLMFMNPDKPCKTLLISSAAPSEGKTTVACSIAIALAQGGQRVCIIDCDLRRPRLHRIFHREGSAGVTNVLLGEASIEDVAKPTVIANLWSMPAGPLPPNPADILQSTRFRKFIDDLSGRFDRVVIDSPPLVAVTDSAIISTVVDGTVFVVLAFVTGKHVSLQGLRALRDVESPIVGGVLNAVNLNRSEYTYYQYYNYKREGYSSRAEDTEEAGADLGASPPN
ncbi:MAG: GumC family protein, partial [Polyangiaceae bacterium]